jgi:hypothetical protein
MADIDTGLIGWWKFNEGSGATALDNTANGYNGTEVGSPSYVTGKVGKYALNLVGASSQYVTLPAAFETALAGLTSFTFSGWVYCSTLSQWQRVFDWGTGQGVYMFLTMDNGATSTPRFAITTGGPGAEQQVTAPSAVSTGAWHFVVVTLTGATAKLYIDSPTAVATNTGMTLTPTSLGTTTQCYFGKSQWADPYFDGNIQDFRLYNRALSDADVALLMSYTGVAADDATGLCGRWQFTENAGTTAWDTSGNANTGTLVNSPTWATGRSQARSALSLVSASSQSVSSGVNNLPAMNTSWTYMGWIYVNSAGSGIRDIICTGDGSTSANQFRVNGGLQLEWSQWGGNILATSTVNVNTSVWVHVALTYNLILNTYTFYINGVPQGTGTPAYAIQTGTISQMLIGTWGYGEFFYGLLSDIRMYNRCLTLWDVQLAASDQPWGR